MRKTILFLFLIFAFTVSSADALAQTRPKRKRPVKTRRAAAPKTIVIYRDVYRDAPPPPVTPPQQYEQPRLFRKVFAVSTSRTMWFPIPFGQTQVYGRFEVGENDNIYMWIMDDDELRNFNGGNSYRRYYESGSRTVDNFSVILPNNRQHYLVFQNKNIFTNKIVTLDVNISQ